MSVITNAAFFGVICVFIAEPITTGGLALITLLAGAIVMTICAVLITKFKMAWLREFALAISMMGAMACSVIFSRIILYQSLTCILIGHTLFQ